MGILGGRTALAGAVAALIAVTVPAALVQAARVPGPATRAKMAQAALRYAKKHTAYSSFYVDRVRVSSVSSRWGAARVTGPDGNAARVLLRHSSHGWAGRSLGTAFDCSQAPRAVLKDLVGGCVP